MSGCLRGFKHVAVPLSSAQATGFLSFQNNNYWKKKNPLGDEKPPEAAARSSRYLIYSFLKLWTHLAGLLGHSLPVQPLLRSN